MNENVTYKALLYIILGVIVVIMAFFGNAQSKIDQVGKNEHNIEKVNTVLNEKIDKINSTMNINQLIVIKSLNRIELQLKDKQNRQ